ncbi:MAG: tRNA-intron lyase [Candidatus Nitrosocaldus sp.]
MRRERKAVEEKGGEEEGREILAMLKDDKVIVDDPDVVEELRRKGYGDRDEHDGRYFLYMYEALYLLYTKRMSIKGRDEEEGILSFDEVVSKALKHDPSIWTKFLIYRDLRSRGYVAREGFGFGNDFRVYERGDYSIKSARYIVFGLNEGREVKIDDLSRMVEQIGSMGKEPIVAVIERRGEVIYYSVERMRFAELKKVSIQSMDELNK